MKLTREQLASRFHLPLGTVRDWDQGAHRPDKAAQILLSRESSQEPLTQWCALSKASFLQF
jgi:hypothetical protein